MAKRQNEWTEAEKLAVWRKATEVPPNDPNVYRKDLAGAWMQWDKHGDTSSEFGFGWEIDHKYPVAKGGSDNIDNLQPLQWANNRYKGDNYPRYQTLVSSNGNQNIKKVQSW